MLRVREYSGAVKVGATTYSPLLPLGPAWRQVAVDHVTGMAGSTLDFQVLCEPARPGGRLMIDDVTIRDLTAGAQATPFGSREVAGSTLEPAKLLPNPFRDRALLAWSLTHRGAVRVALFDVGGRKVRTVFEDAALEPGTHHFVLDQADDRGKRLGAGVYFYRIESPDGNQIGRFVILE